VDGRREVVVHAAEGAMVLVGLDLAVARREVWALAGTVAAIGGLALVLSLGGGWWLVNRALAPAEGIGRTARAMVDGDFGARIATDRFETEFRQLALALNEAFDRLHASLEGQRRFSADASHELRTPLATLSTEVQWALGRPRTLDELRQSLVVVARAASRMEGVVERLLALARAGAAVDRDERGPVHLADLVRSVVDDLTPLAAHRGVSLQLSAAPGLVVNGDAARLVDALTNVLANAVEYGPAGRPVTVAVDGADRSAVVTVQDAGPGIAAADLPRVFEPFFRADPARSRNAGGAGLGLTLTRAIVEGHGGTVTCTSAPGHGTTVTMRLPRLA
jgi:signal transduction histidine kinase